MADAAEHRPDITWVLARVQGDELVASTISGEGQPVGVGERVTFDDDTDLVLPLRLPDGSTFALLGGLGAGRMGTHPAEMGRIQRMVELLDAVAGAEWEAQEQASRADEATRRALQVEVEALTDALTGAANRRAWDRALEAEDRRHRRYGGPAAVVVVDLDELKEINDSQGHLHGDLLLRLVARVIKDSSRESDLVARTGGDEFAVLALNCEEPQLQVLVDRLRKAFEAEEVSASVGGACRRGAASMAEVWAEADDLMFGEKAKRKG